MSEIQNSKEGTCKWQRITDILLLMLLLNVTLYIVVMSMVLS